MFLMNFHLRLGSSLILAKSQPGVPYKGVPYFKNNV